MDEIVKDGFDFGLETDSLSDSMGASLPNRSLCLITGLAGSGKSLVSQRLTFGLLMNGSKVVAVTTELTTRGWIEQMNSLGYFVADYIAKGRLVVISRFGTIAEPIPGIGLNDVLDSEVMAEADFIIIDSASSIMEMEIPADESFATLQKLRKFSSSGHSLLLTLDPTGTNAGLLQDLRSSAEVVLDMSATLIGGTLKRDLQVTRFLRAAGPVQTNVSWRVEPGMGFIVDITAVS